MRGYGRGRVVKGQPRQMDARLIGRMLFGRTLFGLKNVPVVIINTSDRITRVKNARSLEY